MSSRWSILALLFCVRVTMAFQSQAVAALSPYIMESYGVGLADIGLLIGLYLSPGILIAFPGAAIGRRFGDKQTVAFGLVLMLLGGLVVALMPTWEAQIAGRVLAGTGGVILNVLMSKMVTDWFAGHNLATAMGIFINSWPVGIAAALLVLPFFAETIGLSATMGLISGFIATGLVLLVTLYQPPNKPAATNPTRSSQPDKTTLVCIFLAGVIWALYNSALAMIFGFGPAMLVERGWSASAASSTTSIVLWLVAISVPLGGLIADRFKCRDLVLAGGVLSFAVLIFITPMVQQSVMMFITLGVAAGLAAGPIMSLPAEILPPEDRAHGMGLFFTIYYFTIVFAPMIGGRLSDSAGTAAVAFTFGGVMLLVCLPLLALFKVFANKAKGMQNIGIMT